MPNIRQIVDTELEVAGLGIVAIAVLSFVALMKGVDSVMFTAAIAGIGGIIGWVFKGIREKLKSKEK